MLVSARLADAHSGVVALALPVDAIEVDGDLSDWPAGLPSYPISVAAVGRPPLDAADFNGRFRVAYTQADNALLVAVSVTDESPVVSSTEDAVWDSQDGCEVYVDWRHGDRDSPAAQYAVYGAILHGRFVDFAARHRADGHDYEWRIDAGALDVSLAPGMSIAMDVVVCDRDEDGSFSWMTWGKGTNKVAHESRRGDVVLVGPEAGLGALRGRLGADGAGTAARLRIRSLAVDRLVVDLATDADGRFATQLPVGRYGVTPLTGTSSPKADSVEVLADAVTELAIELGPLRGRVVSAGPGRVVQSSGGSRRGEWRLWGVPDGLPSAYVLSLLQDRRGHMWFVTLRGGICRYDGDRFTVFGSQQGLPDPSVQAILEDSRGDLWFGTGWRDSGGGGLCRFDGQRFEIFDVDNGLPDNSVQCLLEDRAGHLWLGTYEGGVSRFDGRQFTTFTVEDGLADNSVWAIHEDSRGDLWFGTGGWGSTASVGGVTHYDGTRFTSFPIGNTAGRHRVWAIHEDESGNLWFGTRDAGVYRFDRQRQTFEPFDVDSGLAGNKVWAIAETQDGDMWFATRGGVSRYDGSRWTSYTTEDGLPHSEVFSLYEDRAGRLWVGGGGGVTQYEGAYLRNLTEEDGLAEGFVWSVLEDRRGHMWFGTEGAGVSRYDGDRFTTYTVADGLAHNSVEAMLEDRNGNLWFGTHGGGLSRFDGSEWTTFGTLDGLPHRHVMSLAEDHNGSLWIGTFSGLSRFDGSAFTNYTTEDGLPHNRIPSLFEDRAGSLWVGTSSGPVRFDGRTFTRVTAGDGLQDLPVLDFEQDRTGRLWLATRGVALYEEGRLVAFPGAAGLPYHNVSSILRHSSGTLWFGTLGGGAAQYDGDLFQGLLKRDGLTDDVVFDMVEDRNGDVWLATSGGVTRYRPYRAVPSVWITDVIAESRRGPVEELSLPTSQRYLAFEFRGSSLKTPADRLLYRYRLLGVDEDWQTTAALQVEYADLPAGSYTFEVLAVERDLTYSEEPARVHVSLHFPYETAAWIAALACSLGLVAWQGVRLLHRDQRLRQTNVDLRSEMQERERIEAERARLDQQLASLRYLDRLRGALEGIRGTQEAMEVTGQALLEVMSAPAAAVRLRVDRRTLDFGAADRTGTHQYERSLAWGSQERGRLEVYLGMALSEGQERMLLDETAAQLARRLEALELMTQLLQSARLVSLGELAAGVAHELNQPLTAISMVTGDLRMRVDGGEAVEATDLGRSMDDVAGFVERMAETISHLRIFARDSPEAPSVAVDLNEVVESSLKMIGMQLRNQGIEISLELTPDLPAIDGQPFQLEQVFLNLLANGRDAVNERADDGDKRLVVRTRRGGNGQTEVVAEVEDNGVGVAEEHLAHLFDPFYTTKSEEEGTGLGLSISYAIVRNHAGRIECTSQVGQGTLFRLQLPVSEPAG